MSSAAASGNEPDCECPINTAPFNWVARSDNALSVGLGVGRPPKLTSGTPCFGEFVHRVHRELTVRVGRASLRAKSEVRPDDFVAESDPTGKAGRGRRARAHVVEDGLVESRPPAPHLVRHVHGMALAHEVFVPAHPTVRRGLPRLPSQGRAMDHHHRKIAVTALRHHVPDVHLIDGDVAPRTEVAQFHLCLFSLVAADEEAALCLQHQRRVGRLNILERLRYRGDGRAEDAGKGDSRPGWPIATTSRIADFSRVVSCLWSATSRRTVITARPAAPSAPSVRGRAACRQRAPTAPSCRPARESRRSRAA